MTNTIKSDITYADYAGLQTEVIKMDENLTSYGLLWFLKGKGIKTIEDRELSLGYIQYLWPNKESPLSEDKINSVVNILQSIVGFTNDTDKRTLKEVITGFENMRDSSIPLLKKEGL